MSEQNKYKLKKTRDKLKILTDEVENKLDPESTQTKDMEKCPRKLKDKNQREREMRIQ